MAGNHFNGRKSTRLSDAIRLNGETSSNEIVAGDTKFNDNEVSEPSTTVNASAAVSWFSTAIEMVDSEVEFHGFGPLDKEEEDFLLAPISMLSITDDFIDSRRFLKHFDCNNYINDESEGDEENQENKTMDGNDCPPSSRMSDDDSGGAPQGLVNKDLPVNEALLKPFSLGWKREFVCRAVPDPKISRNQGEVYYHTPSGKKLRSSKEVKQYLSDGLTLENFTFSKISLGTNDPAKEIIREAKLVNKRSSTQGPADVVASNILGKRQPKQKFPKGASPPPEKMIIKSAAKPKSKSTILRPVISATGVATKKIENRKSLSALHKSGSTKYDKGTLEMGMLPPWGDSSGTKRPAAKSKAITPSTTSINPSSQQLLQPSICKMNNQSKKSYLVMDPCSIQCLRAMGMIPTLQCQLCLCLFHNECVDMCGVETVKNYICPNCQAAANEKKSLTTTSITSVQESQSNPISIIRTNSPILPTPPKQFKPSNKISDMVYSPSNQSLHMHVMTNSKTQKSVESKHNKNKFVTVPKYMKINQNEIPKHEQQSKGLVGSLTTWMPPSSDVQVKNSNEQNMVITQDIVDLNGRKYIVVPKHNVLSVSPQNHTEDTTELTSAEPKISRNITPDKLELTNATNTLDDVSNPAFIEPNHTISSVTKSLALNETTDNNKTKDDPGSNLPDSSMSPVHTPRRKIPKNVSKTSHSSPIPHQTQESAVPPEEPMDYDIYLPKPGPSRIDAIQEPVLGETEHIKHCTPREQKQVQPGWYFFQGINGGFLALKKIFKYLKIQDLLRCSRVSVMFRDIAMNPALWREVKLKNSQVVDAQQMCRTLTELRSWYLDMRKTIPPSNMERFWDDFSANIGFVTTLAKLDLSRCSAETVHKIFQSNPNLEYFNAGAIASDSMSLEGIGSMKFLRELRFKSLSGIVLNSSLQPLEELSNTLVDLSLTSVKQLGQKDVDVIGRLRKLYRLEIGECSELPEKFGTETLTQLPLLRRLRFEKGQGDCPTDDLLTGVSMMPTITCLELVNFDIKAGFDKSLTVIKNVKKLLIIPTYISQSATTNRMVLAGVINLKNLTSFSWGVTHELLRVTDLFVDQIAKNEKNDQNSEAPGPSIPQHPVAGENIPVLKPVPGRVHVGPKEVNPQVEILPLPELQAILNHHLPNSKVIILKMPFSGSWRQFIND